MQTSKPVSRLNHQRFASSQICIRISSRVLHFHTFDCQFMWIHVMKFDLPRKFDEFVVVTKILEYSSLLLTFSDHHHHHQHLVHCALTEPQTRPTQTAARTAVEDNTAAQTDSTTQTAHHQLPHRLHRPPGKFSQPKIFEHPAKIHQLNCSLLFFLIRPPPPPPATR